MNFEAIQTLAERILTNILKVIVGKDDKIRLLPHGGKIYGFCHATSCRN